MTPITLATPWLTSDVLSASMRNGIFSANNEPILDMYKKMATHTTRINDHYDL